MKHPSSARRHPSPALGSADFSRGAALTREASGGLWLRFTQQLSPFTAPEIACAHDDLRAEIAALRSRVHSAVQERCGSDLRCHLSAGLEHLCAELSVHFEMEERGGVVERVLQQQSPVATVARLREQHRDFLVEGARLTEALRAGLASPALLARVCWLLDRLSTHELEEQRLMLV